MPDHLSPRLQIAVCDDEPTDLRQAAGLTREIMAAEAPGGSFVLLQNLLREKGNPAPHGKGPEQAVSLRHYLCRVLGAGVEASAHQRPHRNPRAAICLIILSPSPCSGAVSL